MGAAAFAALESRLNSAVLQRLSNAEATLGGASVVGIFDSNPAAFDVVSGNAPRFVLASTSVPADPRGQMLVVGGVNYAVRDYTQDGTGMCTLQLEEAV